MTRRTTLAALPLALLALAAPAAAKDGRQHTTYRAALAAVAAAEPTAAASRVAKVRGKAVLVDGRRRDRVKLRVRGLDRGASYTWEIRQGGCAGEAVPGFRYRALKVRRGGAKGRGVSRSFTAAPGASYALVVTGPEGDVACGEFERRGGGKRRADAPKDERADEPVGCEDDAVDDAADDAADEEPAEGYHAGAARHDDPDESCDDEAADDDELDADEPAYDDDLDEAGDDYEEPDEF